MHHLRSGQGRQRGTGDVLAGTDPTRGVAELARVGAGVVEQFAQAVGRQVLACDQGVAHGGDRTDGDKVHQRVVGQFFIQADIGGDVGEAPHQQGVAIGRGLGGRLGADQGSGTSAVLHHHRLPQYLRQTLRHHPTGEIEATTGGLRHDHAQGAVGKVLRLHRRDPGQAQGNRKKYQ